MIKGGTPSMQTKIRTQLSPGYQLSWLPFPRNGVLKGSQQCPQSLILSLPGLFLPGFHSERFILHIQALSVLPTYTRLGHFLIGQKIGKKENRNSSTFYQSPESLGVCGLGASAAPSHIPLAAMSSAALHPSFYSYHHHPGPAFLVFLLQHFFTHISAR